LAEQHVARLSEQIDQAIEQLQRPARGMQGSMFDEGPSRDEKIKPIPQDAQTEDMLGESTDPETLARMEAARLSVEIEKRNKGRTQVEGASLTPQERLDLLAAREADLANRLERAETQKVGSSLGVEEKDILDGLRSELNAVRKDMQATQDEIASGKTAPTPRVRSSRTSAPRNWLPWLSTTRWTPTCATKSSRSSTLRRPSRRCTSST
jgi:hypothetical protein